MKEEVEDIVDDFESNKWEFMNLSMIEKVKYMKDLPFMIELLSKTLTEDRNLLPILNYIISSSVK